MGGRSHGAFLSLCSLSPFHHEDRVKSFRIVQQGRRLKLVARRAGRKKPLGARECGRGPQKERAGEWKELPNCVCKTSCALRTNPKKHRNNFEKRPGTGPPPAEGKTERAALTEQTDCLRKSTQNRKKSIFSRGDPESRNRYFKHPRETPNYSSVY